MNCRKVAGSVAAFCGGHDVYATSRTTASQQGLVIEHCVAESPDRAVVEIMGVQPSMATHFVTGHG